MRRPLTVLAFVVCSLAAFPSRADAYFWDWIDDLSGPSFWGVTVEFRIWCSFEDSRNNRGYLVSLRRSIMEAAEKYEAAATDAPASSTRQQYYQQATQAVQRGLKSLDRALNDLASGPRADVSDSVLEALVWHKRGEERFERGKSTPDTSMIVADALPPDGNRVARSGTDTGGGGISVSLCKASQFARQSQFLTVNIGYGWDKAKEDEAGNSVNLSNKMVTMGASYHAVIKPFLTIGFGAGLATFTSNTTEPVHKLYVQPYIIDFKPLALRKNSQLRGPWWHVLFFRYDTILFPAGFAEGSFEGQKVRFPAEIVHSVGIHADVEPLLRKWMDTW